MPRAKTTVVSTGAKAPTNELGAILGGNFSASGMAPWSSFVDEQEYVPDLVWPRSVGVYERMRWDTQIAALYNATVQALLKFEWQLDPNGSDDEIVQKLSKDYNLPILGEGENRRMRSKRRFSFRHHLRKAFYAGIYGHYYFEQVGYIGDDRNPPNDGKWHLRKLAERPPRTIQDFRIADDGGLVSIIQNIAKGGVAWSTLPEIPVDRLVGYVWDQEGSSWVGRSWFRPCYKNWVIKDRLLRIDAINHERAGGVPYIEGHPGATDHEIAKLNEMAAQFRIGDTSGGAVPNGAKLVIAKGTNSSVVDSIRYHDEAMARAFMLMVMQLGQTRTGSRALGTTFVDFWGGGLEAIANWFCDSFNEFVIEDDVDWNWGEEVEQVPILSYQFDPEIAVADLVSLTTGDNPIIQVDEELEVALRKEMGLPEKGTPRTPPVVPQAGGGSAGGGSDAPSRTPSPAKQTSNTGGNQ